MKKAFARKGILFLVSIVFVVSLAGISLGFDDGDFQYWNTENVSIKLRDDWKLKIEEEFRFGDNITDFYYQHTDVGVTYSGIAEWLDLGLNYRLVFEESGDWRYENRPYLNATVKHNVENFKLSNRGMLEYRDKEKGKDGWRYRNKFTVKMPYEIKDFKLTPYIADEIFVDFIEGGLNRNRLYAGVGFKVFKNVGIDLFYLWQISEKSGDWTNANVLGTKVKLAF